MAAALAITQALRPSLPHTSRRTTRCNSESALRNPNLTLVRSQGFSPLFSGDWDNCEALASSDDVFKFFVRGQEITELTTIWKHVEDVMQSNVITTSPDTPLAEAAEKRRAHGIGGMPVVDGDNKLVGILCKSDFVRGGATVAHAMTEAVVTVHETDDISTAAALMMETHLDRLPVVDSQYRVIGIVSRTDLFWTLVVDNDHSEDLFQWHDGNM